MTSPAGDEPELFADVEGWWDPSPEGVLAAVCVGIAQAPYDHRQMLVLLLGRRAMDMLRPVAEGTGMPVQAEMITAESDFHGFVQFIVTYCLHPEESDLITVAAVSDDGAKHTSVFTARFDYAA